MKAVLGLDTSCYVTSLALVDEAGGVLLNGRTPLPIPPRERGLRQSKAVFAHVRQLPALFQEHAPLLASLQVTAVAASTAPRPGPDSYMPVFRVGEGLGKVYAQALGVPFFSTNHQDGHIAAALADSGLETETSFLAMHLSGGTTELLWRRAEETALLGGTLDLHAGQLVDRLGVEMGCPFPAGKALEALALQGQAQGLLGVSCEGTSCHFSGAETQAQRLLARGMPKDDVAAELYDFLARTVLRLLEAGSAQTGEKRALLAGGVASSVLLRTLLTARVEKRRIPIALHFAKPDLAGDNAVGVARIGLRMWREGR